MATTLGVAQALPGLISDLICARPRKTEVHPYLISLWLARLCSMNNFSPKHSGEMPHSSVPGYSHPRGGPEVWKANAFYPFYFFNDGGGKGWGVFTDVRFLLLCKIHLIVDPLLGSRNNLFIPSCAATVCTTLNFQKQLGLRQREKPSFW